MVTQERLNKAWFQFDSLDAALSALLALGIVALALCGVLVLRPFVKEEQFLATNCTVVAVSQLSPTTVCPGSTCYLMDPCILVRVFYTMAETEESRGVTVNATLYLSIAHLQWQVRNSHRNG